MTRQRSNILKIITNINDLQLNNTAIAIGKFDGIHKGHRLLVEELLNFKAKGYLATIFTFSKTPNEIIRHSYEKSILTKEEKYMYYENMGIDVIVKYTTSDELLGMNKEEFLSKILVGKLGIKAIVCGNDFKFGHNRTGDTVYLEQMSKKYGYTSIIIDKLKDHNSDISSTRIRSLIAKGQIEEVNRLLGYSYNIIGQVVHGNEIGRTINFPTANIIPNPNKLLPPNGVYFTKVNIDGTEYDGITNIGKKPTVSNTDTISVETNILNYNGNLYGKILCIEFFHYHREEKRFVDIDELKKQISMDVECYKNIKK